MVVKVRREMEVYMNKLQQCKGISKTEVSDHQKIHPSQDRSVQRLICSHCRTSCYPPFLMHFNWDLSNAVIVLPKGIPMLPGIRPGMVMA